MTRHSARAKWNTANAELANAPFSYEKLFAKEIRERELKQMDALTYRYMELSGTQNIPDIYAYAWNWYWLALAMEAAGRLDTGAQCRGRALQYAPNPAGAYIRMIYNSFSELIPV